MTERGEVSSSIRSKPDRHFDEPGCWNAIFMRWVKPWIDYINKEVPDLKSLHPLPDDDQFSHWQPLFSKHISDGVLRLELAEAEMARSKPVEKKTRPYRSIFLRALLLTFWRRALIMLVGSVAVDMVGIGTAIVLKYLIDLLTTRGTSLFAICGYVGGAALVDMVHTMLQQHVKVYINRLEICMHFTIVITLFQHGFCHRRHYSSVMKNNCASKTCNNVVHHCGEGNKLCSSNPLFCPARRHQNRELPPSMYIYMVLDADNITLTFQSMIAFITFACNFLVGLGFIRKAMGLSVFWPSVAVMVVVLTMLGIESINGFILKYSLESMDYRISLSSQIFGNLHLTGSMGIDDVAYRAIEDSRNDELSVLRTRLLFVYINRVLERSTSILLYWVFVYIFNDRSNN